MKITTNTQALAQEVRLLSKIAATKPTLPILGHILLKAEDQLYLSATDYEVSLSTTCQSIISETGEMTLPAKALLDILDQLPDADVTISEGSITSGAFRSRLASLPVNDFPRLPEVNGGGYSIPASTLRELVERTEYAISDKEQKFVLKGALFSFTKGVVAMVATDGKRLSIVTAGREDEGEDLFTIIPIKALDSIMDQAPTGEVKFSRSERQLFFNYGRRLLISRMIDGEYPKYQRIIPKANDQIVQVDRGALMAAIRRVGLVAESLTMRFTTDSIDLSSRSAEIGDADETCAARYSGPEIKVNVNWKFVLDFLEHATEPIVSIAAKDDKSPLLLTDGPSFLNVIMVMR